MSSRIGVYLFLLVFAVLGAGLYVSKNYEMNGLSLAARKDEKAEKKKKEAEEKKAIPVEVVQASSGSISAHVYATANLRALRDVTLKSQAPGVVREILAEEGAFVKQGQVLARLDDRELEINVDLAKQRLEQTRIQLESAKILREKNLSQIAAKQDELARNEKALAEGLVSDTDVALLRNQLAELGHDERAQAATVREREFLVEQLTSEIARDEVLLSNTEVKAPFAGRIVERTAELGQTVGSADALFRLASFSPLFADAYISEQDSRRVRPGQPVEVSLGAAGEDSTRGRVLRVSPVVDDSTGTVKVTTEIRASDTSFRPGAFVRVRIETDVRDETVLAPKKAVIEEDGESFVFVNAGETAEKRTVEIGYEDGASIEIRSGLKPGESVVVAGQGALKDGDKTRIVGS